MGRGVWFRSFASLWTGSTPSAGNKCILTSSCPSKVGQNTKIRIYFSLNLLSLQHSFLAQVSDLCPKLKKFATSLTFEPKLQTSIVFTHKLQTTSPPAPPYKGRGGKRGNGRIKKSCESYKSPKSQFRRLSITYFQNVLTVGDNIYSATGQCNFRRVV